MATQQNPPFKVDRYVVVHVATTCDEHGVYVTKDSAEVIELGWILLDANTLDELHRESVLVKPVNTPITPLCSESCLAPSTTEASSTHNSPSLRYTDLSLLTNFFCQRA
jgi:hypothetical protein